MAYRHKVFKSGGKVMKSKGKPAVMSEAQSTENRKSGGEVSVVGKKAGGRLDRNVGGAVASAGNPKVLKEAKEKKRGGSVGSDKSPFSSAGGGSASKNPFSSARKG